MHEIGNTLTTILAVCRLHGKRTSFVDGVLVSVGTRRLLFFLAMQAFRLAIASLLGYGGAYFIGHTIALGDLILNCIALEVRSSFSPASSLRWAFSCMVGYACPLYCQHAPVLCGRAPRLCRGQGCAAKCGSVLHAVPQTCGVKCAPGRLGGGVPCHAWLWRACTASAHRVALRQVVRCTAWFGRMRVIVTRARMRAHYAVQMLVIPGAAVIAMHSGTQTLAVVRAWQFVMEIDTVLFACFAPRNLKRALAKSAELVVASLPTFRGMDLAPVLKLIAALTMVGCLLGTIIVPQNSLIDDAEATLCGTRRAHLVLRSGRAPLRTVYSVRRRVGQLGVG